MKKIKRGFTLAEVATALGIVGVVAALVIPMVSKNIQEQQSGAVLGRAIEQIETGNQNLIQIANTNRDDGSYSDVLALTALEDVGGAGASSVLTNFMNIVPGYWGLSNRQIPNTEVVGIRSFNGGDGGQDARNVGGGTRYAFSKIPAGVAISGNSNFISNDLEGDTGIFVYIDTNGWDKRPNMTGKDIFAFKLRNSGALVPATETEAGARAEEVIRDGFKIKY